MEFLKSLVTWWNSQTLNTRLHTWRNGVKVGEDEQGNIYYTTRDEKRRGLFLMVKLKRLV